MILPVARSIAELFDSRPDRHADAARRVPDRGDVSGIGGRVRDVHHRPGEQPARRQPGAEAGERRRSPAPSWFMAAIVPGLLSCLVVPWITYRDAHARRSRTRRRRRRSRAPSCARWARSAATNGSRCWCSPASACTWLTTVIARPRCDDGRAASASACCWSPARCRWQTAAERAIGVGRVRLVRRHAAHGRAAQRHRLDDACSPRTSPAMFVGIPWHGGAASRS